MHELSIAVSLIEAAGDKARESGAERIVRFFLRIGPLSGVVPEALRSAFPIAAEMTPAEGAELTIEDVPVVVRCEHCEAERELDRPYVFCCPDCGRPISEIVSGKELELTALEIR